MPSKKGKGKGKRKSKGKGKGKRKERDDKTSVKDKEVALQQATCDAKLWEMRFQAAEKSREVYRESSRRLVEENDQLQAAISQTEKDTVKVIGFLKREEGKKDEEVVSLHEELEKTRGLVARERREVAEQCKRTVDELQSQFQDKTAELSVMQGELKTVKEFRKHRTELEAQLTSLRTALTSSEQEHQAALQALEHRLFEEKMRLQKEANLRIAELSEKAHFEAVRNLGQRTREVYHENVCMSEALTVHRARVEELERKTQQLEMTNRQLTVENELNQKLVATRVHGARRYQQQISELQEKVSSLEASLVTVVKEFDQERERQVSQAQRLLQEAREEAESQRCRADHEAAELAHVRCLARRILQQRSEVEHFLLGALQHVKRQVAANRSQYCRDAAVAYQSRVREATRGHTRFPAVRTFRPLPDSTNSVYHDLDTAAHWEGVGDRVDVSELTWEQKEQVLRFLFSRINETTPTNQPPPPPTTIYSPPPPPPPSRDVFLTQPLSIKHH